MYPGILGGSKKNITIQQAPNNPDKLHVNYGMMPLYEVSSDKNAIDYRLMVASLFNQGFKKKEIVESCGVSYLTVRKWAKALETIDDPEKLIVELQGNKQLKKLTPEIIGYIRGRFRHLYQTSRKGYNTQIREEIQQTYHIRLTPEMIRIHTKDIREEITQKEALSDKGTPPIEEYLETPFTTRIKVQKEHFSYAGICAMFPWISRLLEGLEALGSPDGYPVSVKKMVFLWLIQTLLGAKNLEQARYLDQKSLGYLCDMKMSPCVKVMRSYLRAYSQSGLSESITTLLKENMMQFIPKSDDYYIDGHFLPYYGEAEILKGWCSKRHLSMKGNVHYFIHNQGGDPLYFELHDNFLDFRTILKRFTQMIAEGRNREPFWIIYDRGGFGVEVFQSIADNDGYFVTWEKGFTAPPTVSFPRSMKLKRCKNELDPTEVIHIEYAVETYKVKETMVRRILIKCSNKKDKEKISSILSNDFQSTAPDLIRKILRRWCQENDFKMEDTHFGIGGITSYATIDYKDIEDILEDKEVKTGEYKALTRTIQELKQRRDDYCKKLGRTIAKHAVRKELSSARLTRDSRMNLEQIEVLDKEIKSFQEERKTVNKTIRKIDRCIKEGSQRKDFGAKFLMDSVKVAARNAYYDLAREFLQIYANRRDYHAVLRHLLRQSGNLVFDPQDGLKVQIRSFGPDALQAACRELLAMINQENPAFINGKDCKFQLELVNS
jgi:transposase